MLQMLAISVGVTPSLAQGCFVSARPNRTEFRAKAKAWYHHQNGTTFVLRRNHQFVHIPKCGGSTIERFLRLPFQGHREMHHGGPWGQARLQLSQPHTSPNPKPSNTDPDPFHCDHTDPGPLTVCGARLASQAAVSTRTSSLSSVTLWSAVLTRCPGATVPARKQAQPPARCTYQRRRAVCALPRPIRAYAVHAVRACPTFVPRTKVT